MKHKINDFIIMTNEKNFKKILAAIEGNLKSEWVKTSTDSDTFGDNDMYCYIKEGKESVAVWIAVNELHRVYLSNIVRKGTSELTPAEYNSYIDDFFTYEMLDAISELGVAWEKK